MMEWVFEGQRLTAVGDGYAQQDDWICCSSLTCGLNSAYDGGDDHINHQYTQYDGCKFVFEFGPVIIAIRRQFLQRMCQITNAAGLFPIEKRKHATISEAMMYWSTWDQQTRNGSGKRSPTCTRVLKYLMPCTPKDGSSKELVRTT